MQNVTIYTTPVCVWCHRAKSFFQEHGVNYTEKNVAFDHAAGEEMIQKSGQMGVPVIDINGQIVIGFDEGRIRQLLEIK